MKTKRELACLAWFAAATACDRTIDRFTAPSGPPVIVAAQLSSALVKSGDSLSIALRADQPISTCAVAVAGQSGACNTPLASACQCTYAITDATPEGLIAVVLTVANGSAQGNKTVTIQVDREPPQIAAASVAIVRTAIGQPDMLSVAANAIVDPLPAYTQQGIAAMSAWEDATSPTPIAVIAAPLVGQAQTVALGTATTAPASVWLSATDAVGNQSARVAIATGAANQGPVIDGSKISLAVDASGATLSASAGAISDPVSTPVSTRAFLQASGGQALPVTLALADDGSFPAISLGQITGLRVFVEATSKVGLVSSRSVARNVAVTISSANGVPHAPSPTAFTIYDVAYPSQNREDFWAPGVGPLLSDEIDAAGYAAVASPTGTGITMSVSDSATITSAWAASAAPDPPTTRINSAAAYDSRRHRTVIFGGANFTVSGRPLLGDTWEYDGAWHAGPASGPSARESFAMTYDATRGTVVLFGGALPSGQDCGSGSNICADTWLYDGQAWSQAHPAHSPPARSNATLVFDATSGRSLMFGGGGGDSGCDGTDIPYICSGLWSYDGNDWKMITSVAAQPSPRVNPAMAYDARLHHVFMYGGVVPSNLALCPLDPMSDLPFCTDTWNFDGYNWHQDLVIPAPAPSTEGFAPAVAAFDIGNAQTVVLDPQTQFWTYGDPGTWSQDSANLPTDAGLPRVVIGFVYDAYRQQTVALTAGETTVLVFENGRSTGLHNLVNHLFANQLDPAGQMQSLRYTYTGGGASDDGFESYVQVWDWSENGWVGLIQDTDAATDVPNITDSGSVSNGSAPLDYLNEGRLWFVASSSFPSNISDPDSPSSQTTHYLQAIVSYTLPAILPAE